MPVSVSSYGGKAGFKLRTVLPNLTSMLYLKLHFFLRYQTQARYIEQLLNQESYYPYKINIETINRCNGKCSFCPASVNAESRPYKKMDDSLLEKIISELEELEFSGVLTFQLNNEPFLDKRMPKILSEARKRIPNATMSLSSNGSVLDVKLLNEIANSLDILLINHYTETYELSDSLKTLHEHINENSDMFKNIEVVMQIRYIHEVLTNRAGTAPNKMNNHKTIHAPCIMPFIDFNVFPDGVVGLCCNDAKEKTNFGNLNTHSIVELFNSDDMKKARKHLSKSRSLYEFCKKCDFIDTGKRMLYAKKLLKDLNV